MTTIQAQANLFAEKLVVDMEYHTFQAEGDEQKWRIYELPAPAQLPTWLRSQVRLRTGMTSVIEAEGLVIELDGWLAKRVMIHQGDHPVIAQEGDDSPSWLGPCSTAHDDRPD